jgi:putative ABC transport system permease protein
MELFKLIFKNAFRHKLRTSLTIAGIAIAILAFTLIRTVLAAWNAGVDASAPDRLITRHAVSIVFPLPVSAREQIRSIPGVAEVSYAHWFGGVYIDERHSQFPQFGVDPETWFTVYPEMIVPADEKETFLRERNAVIVGAKLARQQGWKLGDSVRMRGMIYPGEWDFVIRGIYRGAQKTTDETWFVFHWNYLEERLRQIEPWRAGKVGWYTVKISDPDRSGEISRAIDQRFENSVAETLTETERAFQQEFVSMSGAILTALKIVSIVIVGVILAVLSNTMAMTARERLPEYAALKTLGFGTRHLVFMIAGESILISAVGGGLGLLLTYPAVAFFAKILTEFAGAFFPVFAVAKTTLLACGLIAAGVGLAASIFPAWRAATLNIAEGLRRIG